MTETEEQLKRMVMTFRVSELQMLLGYAGKNKTGRKNELQSRALEIVRLRNHSIHQKIRELYKSIQLEMMSFGERGGASGANMLANRPVSSGINQALSPTYNTQSVGVNTSGYNSRSSSSQVSNMGANVGYNNMQSSHNSYPLSPDVRLKKLPFYDVLGELLKPSTLAPQGSGRYQEAAFTFCLTPQQANKIAHSRDLRPGRQDYTVQVQLRFCLLETTSEQEDTFPPNVTVKVNDKMCPLPSPIPTNKAGVEPKRPSRSVNMTALCKISPTVTNRIHVAWSSEYGRCYVISVYLVQKLTSEDLLQRLKTKGPRLADFTKSLIKQKLREDSECEIATTSLRCSLLCPLGKMRMQLPCRAETCNHLQCFDASLFLLMNERKPTWTCPVCDKAALYDNLVIDGYFQDVLQSSSECSEVTLGKDGSWTPLVVKKEPKETPVEKRKDEVAVETLSDDSDDGATAVEKDDSVIEEVCKKRKKDDVEIICLDSDDEAEPPSKRSSAATPPSSEAPSRRSSAAPPSERAASSSANGSSSADTVTLSNGSGNGESGNAKDSWSVGEVDPGKRLIFRKSASNNHSGGSSGEFNNGVSQGQNSPTSARSGSPQIICLDSPSSSPRLPPQPPASDHHENGQNQGSSGPSGYASASETPNSVAPALSELGTDLIALDSGPSSQDPLNQPSNQISASQQHYGQDTLSAGPSPYMDPLGGMSLPPASGSYNMPSPGSGVAASSYNPSDLMSQQFSQDRFI